MTMLKTERLGNASCSPMRAAILLGVLVVAGMLGLTACGDSDSGTQATSAPATTAAPAATEAPATTEGLTPEPTVFGAASALEVSDAYFATYHAGDIDSMMALYTDDATFSTNYTGGSNIHRTRWELSHVWSWAQGTTLISPECSVFDEVPGAVVTISCAYESRNVVAMAVDAPPVPTRTTMTVTADGISDFRNQYGHPRHNTTEIPFTAWMAANHPEDAEATGCCEGDTVEESIARGELRAQYAAEWAAYLVATNCTFNEGC